MSPRARAKKKATATTAFSINIPTKQVPRVIGAICKAGGYQEEIPGEDGAMIPNPVTPNEYAKQRVIGFVMGCVTAVEAGDAAAAASDAAVTAAHDEIGIT